VKVRDIISRLEAEGWTFRQGSGSHRIYTHAEKPGRVIVSVHAANIDVRPSTWNTIRKAAGWK
jgi:predicted RNA binding protein YcfA (HicA-like mRNA interferase family)